MDHRKKQIGGLIRRGRQAKRYTQMELAERTGIGLRSIQRIENGVVTARSYTLTTLARELDLDLTTIIQHSTELKDETPTMLGMPNACLTVNETKNIIGPLSIAVTTGICMVLFGAAFLSQSTRFPETDFETFFFWAVLSFIYLLILTRIFRR